jgi:plastocyanin
VHNASVLRALALLITATLSASCGGSGSPSTPSDPPAAGRTITITANGASPTSLTIAPGTRVVFVNNDTRAHNMASDPHPEHDQCPEINVAGLVSPGQSRETGNLNTVRTCGFHDHDNPPPDGSRWTGSLVIR